MIFFKNDYGSGAHPKIMEALLSGNGGQCEGYGEDVHSIRARANIAKKLGREDCAVRFVAGGTTANLLLISHALRPYQAVISAQTGHIVAHETGAIEAAGHKILTAKTQDGKLTPELIEGIIAQNDMPPHIVQPKMVYISQPTELGTLYSAAELGGIQSLCAAKGLYLYIDGARMASALAAQEGELGLGGYANLSDAFYIGGTKCGALFGEALVIANPEIARGIDYSVKQRGALLSKGRTLGIQFARMFEDDLYMEIGRHANAMADRIREDLWGMGFVFRPDTATNQIFPEVSAAAAQRLGSEYGIREWENLGEDSRLVRIVTSWATTEDEVEKLLRDMRSLA